MNEEQLELNCVKKNENDCVERWHRLKKNTDSDFKPIKGNWTADEDVILKKRVTEYGLKRWKEVASYLPGRIGK